ncbi:MAG: 4Fe-4S binding protein [Thermodesulfobacteriota bacterium]|nr:4Fe-4S binding protein [Thermodesulfobacteriota bacterium]
MRLRPQGAEPSRPPPIRRGRRSGPCPEGIPRRRFQPWIPSPSSTRRIPLKVAPSASNRQFPFRGPVLLSERLSVFNRVLLCYGCILRRDRCIGCGLCVTTCPEEAIRLELKPEEDRKAPPAHPFETFQRMAQERMERFRKIQA